MKTVVQEDGMGCGLACVASVSGCTYSQVLKKIPQGKIFAETKGFSPKTLCELLSILGKSYLRKHLKTNLKHYPPGSIIYLKRSKHFPFGHYMAKTELGWMDPWINLPNYPRKAGFRKRLSQTPSYLIFPIHA